MVTELVVLVADIVVGAFGAVVTVIAVEYALTPSAFLARIWKEYPLFAVNPE